MKALLKLISGALSIWLLFAGCSKPKDFTASFLKGKIDGVVFECTNINANKPMPTPGSGSDPTIIITGEWPMYTIKLNIYGENSIPGTSITAGSYVFQADKNRSATIWHNNVDAYYAGNAGGTFTPAYLVGSGKITILEIDKNYIKGSFEFVTDANGTTGLSKTVTDGEFYIKRN